MKRDNIRDYLASGTDAVIRAAKRRKERVFIDYNDECGAWVYAVCLDEIPDFWLTTKRTKKEAMMYCKKHGLKLIRQ